jgi:ABC-type multidrug transport system permease subunit
LTFWRNRRDDLDIESGLIHENLIFSGLVLLYFYIWFQLAGLALVIIGILFKFHYSEATDALPANFGVAPILSIIIGAIVFVTAFCGCCGAVKESPCMLTTVSTAGTLKLSRLE